MKTHSLYTEAIVEAAYSIVKDSLVKQAIKSIPFLASGPLNTLLVMIASRIARFLVAQTELAIFFKYTDIRIAAQGRSFVEAAYALRDIRKDSTKTEEEKQDAEKKLISAFRTFAKFNN